MSSQKKLVVIAGPTAVGKTEVAIKVAQHFKTEILSADSRQFFKEISIGTAKPTPAELAAVPHHFIGFISIHDSMSAGEFEKLALSKLEQLFKNYDLVLLTGGSGLYLDAVINGIDEFPEISTKSKNEVEKLFLEGMEKLQEFVKSKDPQQFLKMDIQNPMRLKRVAEVIMESGEPYSSFLNTEKTDRPFDIVEFCLFQKRELLYHRINQRVENMVALGLETEAKSVYHYKNLQALNTVGYKEWFQYFEGELSKVEAIEKIKQHTRNFAKRQLTWFRKKQNLVWIENVNPNKASEEIINMIRAKN